MVAAVVVVVVAAPGDDGKNSTALTAIEARMLAEATCATPTALQDAGVSGLALAAAAAAAAAGTASCCRSTDTIVTVIIIIIVIVMSIMNINVTTFIRWVVAKAATTPRLVEAPSAIAGAKTLARTKKA